MLLFAAVALLVAACASIGHPEGGPRDETPPEYVRSTPAPGAVGVGHNKIDIFFNENIKLEEPSNKIVISPAQKQAPSISSNGKHVSVELRDTLIPNTTYTIDFSDAVRDLNEGNILDGFAVDFSTGESIDTLRISGMVFEARTLEPAQGMVVGVYSNLADSAVRTLPLERVAKTNQYGQFTIRGLRPGTYNIFAINDVNHDWHWDRSEDVAIYPVTVSPSSEQIEVADTLLSSQRTDSVAMRRATRFLPDDVLLTWFNEDYKPYYLRDYKRPQRNQLTFLFGATPDTPPELTILSGPRAGRSLFHPAMTAVERSASGDSLVFWLRDPELAATDSLLIRAVYQKSDSLDRPQLQTDTLRMFFRDRKAKKDKKKEEADTVAPQPVFMDLKFEGAGAQELNLPMKFMASEPLDSFPLGGFRLEMLTDTVWTDVMMGKPMADSLSTRFWQIPVKWEEVTKYRLTADSLAVTGVLGHGIRPFSTEFTTRSLFDYGNVRLNITDIPSDSVGPVQVIVELLDGSDKVVATSIVSGTQAAFSYLAPGKYYARAILDVNANGQWDRGNVATRTLPEDVVYYSKRLNVRKNWDISQDWSLFEIPVDLQKPLEVKKNKPKTREPQQRDTDDQEDEDDSGLNDTWGNGSQYNNAHRGSGRLSGGMQSVKTQR